MFKKLLLSIIFGLSFVSLNGMQPVEPKIKYEDPKITYSKNNFEINALKDNCEIGWILYELLPFRKAEIELFEVNKKYRNDKEERVGQHLFQRCVDHAIKRNCPQVSWTVIPQDDLDLNTLFIIYKKMVEKLSNSESYKLTKCDPYGPLLNKVDMTLYLQK